MRATTLLKPGKFSNSERLRRDVALAISNVEVAKAHGAVGQGADLAKFLADSAQKTPGYTAPALPATQVVLTSGAKVNAVAVTGTGNFATPTIANGVLTGIVLSAS